ncbi:MAG: prepilin-type N-terminal cleavage/methylation domain-containing protein [Terriglobia bacterium]
MKKAEVGFSLIELLVVVAIILIIAAIAIPNLLESRIAANQAAAVADLHGIDASEVTYLTMYNVGYAASLPTLGPPAGNGLPTPAAANLIDSYLANGVRNGYTFGYAAGSQDTQGHYQTFSVHASPAAQGSTGHNFYFTDQSDIIRVNTAVSASASDSPIG